MFGRRHRPTAEPQSGRLLVHALPTCVTLLLGYWQELFDENSVYGWQSIGNGQGTVLGTQALVQ